CTRSSATACRHRACGVKRRGTSPDRARRCQSERRKSDRREQRDRGYRGRRTSSGRKAKIPARFGRVKRIKQEMDNTGAKRTRLGDRINAYVASDRPLREIVGNLSKRAKDAMNEAATLSLERIEITLERLPKKLDGLKCV